jgi:hypothetical protein
MVQIANDNGGANVRFDRRLLTAVVRQPKSLRSRWIRRVNWPLENSGRISFGRPFVLLAQVSSVMFGKVRPACQKRLRIAKQTPLFYALAPSVSFQRSLLQP